MVQLRIRSLVLVSFVVSASLAILVTDALKSRAAPALAAGQPMVVAQVLNVDCPFPGGVDFTTSFVKALDVGTFSVQSADSVVEATFNGRLYVESFAAGSSGAIFEVRVDNTATTHGRARAVVWAAEAGAEGVPVSITGIFTGLSAGNHTISIWVQGASGGGSNAFVNPGCWDSDHIVIKEYTPFGMAFLPAVAK